MRSLKPLKPNDQLFELGYKCGCKFAIYDKSVLVKLCRKHYPQYKSMAVSNMLLLVLKREPEFSDSPEAILGDP